MISLLLGTCAEARADAIARAGPILWRAGGAALYRSEDDGMTWHAVLRVEQDDEIDDAGECTAVAAADERRIAALCDGRLFVSHQRGAHFVESPAPAGARSIVWEADRPVATRAKRDPVRRDGDWACRFDEEGAWISDDRGVTWRELPDAAAYDLIDLIPDGVGGAFAWTSVGVVRLRPEPPEPPETAPAAWTPRLDLAAQYRRIRTFSGSAVLATLTFPLERIPAARRTSSLRIARARLRSRAARLRIASRHVRAASVRLTEGPRRRRLLHADELAAQAAALLETAP